MVRRHPAFIVALAAAAALAAAPAGAASFLDRDFGSPELGVTPRMRALGGAGSALGDGGLSLLDNPAALALAASGARGLRVQLSGSMARASENRLVPLYDTFDSYVHDEAIAVNDHGYGALSLGAAGTHPRLGGVVLALSSTPGWDPRYDYQDERRSTATTDQLLAERFIRTTGTLRETGIGAARAFPGGLAAGAALHVWTGTLAARDALVPHDPSVTARVIESRRELAGVSLGLGGAWRAGPRLTTALAYETGPRLRDRFTAWQDGAVVAGPDERRTEVWPARVHAGAAYRPRNTLRTTFVADAVWTDWSAVTDAFDPTLELLDTWDLRFGVEHVYAQGLPGRIGFRYERSPVSREADRVWFTFGAGWQVERWALDGAVEVGKRVSRQTPLWDRAAQPGAVGAGLDRVEDTLARVSLGLETRF